MKSTEFPSLSQTSLADLKRLASQIRKEIAQRDSANKLAVQRKLKALLQASGLSLDDLAGAPALKTDSRRETKPVAPKYRNPYNIQETWTGRGRQPAWVKAHLFTGRSLDALLINK